MLFIKMNGIGNDYIFLTNFDKENKDFTELAKRLSSREYGIGGDGLVVIGKNQINYSMDIYNADGSRAKMCGNAIRCVAKYLYDCKKVTDKTFCIDTLSGEKKVTVTLKKDIVNEVAVSMGKAKEFIYSNQTKLDITPVDIGNKHLVVLTKDINEDFFNGRLLQNTVEDGVNVEFVNIIDRKNIIIRVYERGSGETLACGTGASATVYALHKRGLIDENVKCKLKGGELEITIDKEEGIIMKGIARYNFFGYVDI